MLHADFARSIGAQIQIELPARYFTRFLSCRRADEFFAQQTSIASKCAAHAGQWIERPLSQVGGDLPEGVSTPNACIEQVGWSVADRAFCFICNLGTSFSSALVIES